MNDIKFTKTNGGMGRKAANEDPISGLLMYLPELDQRDLISVDNDLQFSKVEAPDGDNDLYVAKLRFEEELTSYGFPKWADALLSDKASDYTAGSEADEYKKTAAINVIAYHVHEFFRMSPEGTLYLGIKFGGFIVKEDVKALQNQSNGSIRQCGIFPLKDISDDTVIQNYQEVATDLEKEHKPLSIIGAACGKKVDFQVDHGDLVADLEHVEEFVSLSDLTSRTLINEGRCNVSVLVGCDLDPEVSGKLGQYAYCGCIGTCMGAISKAAVHECIAWVQKFKLGLGAPGLISGELIKDVTTANQEKVNDNRYIFVRTHVGDADNYFNDSHTLDEATSDYAYIENVRTIDKACRGIRANLLPYLNSPLKVDAETGKLDAPMVAFLETTAGKALEDMEKAGELSGYRAEIDPDQNVLATSQVEILIKNVPMGVMRKVHVKIGFTSSLS